MRFYSQGRNLRILLTLVWAAVGIFWVGVMRDNHGWRVLGRLVWIVLPVVQIATLWSYWETTETHLQHRSFLGRRPSFRLAKLVYAGDVRREGWIGRSLRNSTEVEFSGAPPGYISVADRDAFRHALHPADGYGAGTSE